MDKINKFIKKNFKKIICIIFLVYLGAFYVADALKGEIKEVSYNEFITMVEEDKVEEISITINSDKFKFEDIEGNVYETDNPRMDGFKEFLLKSDVKVNEVSLAKDYPILYFIAQNWPLFLIVGTMCIAIYTVQAGPDSAKSYLVEANKNSIKLDDVILPKNIKKDIMRNINFLKNPSKYQDLGASMPKGMLLVGPPGTGKTMIAKAIANEAGVPFFYASGAEFVELYVGQGARRVRTLFKEAKKVAPCVIFIDEIDAIGATRGNDKSNAEYDQTINALLTSLDGFDSKDGILTIAATNRADILDPGLVREGRFDQHIQIPLPTKANRKSLIVSLREDIKLQCHFDVETLAKRTSGFSGATIKSLLNEAVLIAVDKNSDIVGEDEISEAFEKIVFKSHRSEDLDKNKKEQYICAVHEAGHALVSELMCNINVEGISIIGTVGGAGGYTMTMQDDDKGIYNYNELVNRIKVLYGGAAAEELVLGVRSTGSSNDFERATKLITDMAMKYAMFDHPLTVECFYANTEIYNDELNRIKSKSTTIYGQVKTFLESNEELLNLVAKAVEDEESINRQEFLQLIEDNKKKC